MKPKAQPSPIKLKLFIALCAIIGIPLAIAWFPNTAGSHGTFLDKTFTALLSWVMSTFLVGLCLQFLIYLFLSRKQIFDFLRNPYSWSVSLVVVVLSALSWFIRAIINWSEGGVTFLAIYAMICFIPILVIGLVAAKYLSPRLNISVAIKLLIGSVFTWISVILFLYWFASAFFEPYIFSYPTHDELLAFLDYFWLAFLAVWYIWSTGIRISEKLPPRILQFLTTINTYHPDIEFISSSLSAILVYPVIVVVAEIYYNQVVSTIGVWMEFTSYDKAAWRFSVGLIPFILGIFLFLFIGFATIKLMSQPTLVKQITGNPIASGLIAVLWLFSLWWIFFSSIMTNINFLSPGEFVLASNNLKSPSFFDFFFYTFGVLTTNSLGDIKAVGPSALLASVVATGTGIVLLIPFGLLIGTPFINNLLASNEEKNSK